LAMTSPALADRPGTPNNERATTCNYLTEKPMVCVSFNNTATELVTFDIQFTVDGVEVDGSYEQGQGPAQGRRPYATELQRPVEYHPRGCVGPGCVTAAALPNYLGDAINVFMNGHPNHWAMGKTGEEAEYGSALPPEGFRIVDLDYGVTYCFRFKARRYRD